ncbi:MAG: hypothetical protein H0W63_06145 [Gemmatimonadaceae bacterium]|nr:hypothetical protein [Gemmatimonadaceae bacterium]
MTSIIRCRAAVCHALVLIALESLTLAAFPREVRATTYYVDSRTGSDSGAGISPASAWKGLTIFSAHPFIPGDSILFAKGSGYKGGFIFRQSGTAARPIVFGSYGSGNAPAFSNPDWSVLNGNIFRIEGSHIIVSNLYFHDNTNPPTMENSHHDVQKMGAIYLGLRADSNVVKGCEFERSPVGIKIKGSYNLITGNYLHDASTQMQRTWGAIAIMIVSPHNEIAYNRIERYGYYGGAYGSDGGAIELDGVDDSFDGRDINIHHNVSVGNHGFFELAGRDIDSITVAYNLSDDVDKFVGGGAMKHTIIDHNTVIRTREPNIDRWIFWTFYPEGTALVVTNNIFVVPKDIQVFPQSPKPEGHHRTGIGVPVHSSNLFFSPAGNPDPVGLPLGGGELVADPMFVAPTRGDYRLRAKSPARRVGATLGYSER